MTTPKGIRFDPVDPQADTHCQILRRSNVQVPNLLGRLLFLRPDSEDEQMKEDYYCLLGALFVPWTHDQPLNPSATSSWQDWYLNQAAPPPPRIARLIRNLELLHKTKDEVQFDRLQRASLDGDDDIETPSKDDPDMHQLFEGFEKFAIATQGHSSQLLDAFPLLQNLPDFLVPMRQYAKNLHKDEKTLYTKLTCESKRESGTAQPKTASALRWQRFKRTRGSVTSRHLISQGITNPWDDLMKELFWKLDRTPRLPHWSPLFKP